MQHAFCSTSAINTSSFRLLLSHIRRPNFCCEYLQVPRLNFGKIELTLRAQYSLKLLLTKVIIYDKFYFFTWNRWIKCFISYVFLSVSIKNLSISFEFQSITDNKSAWHVSHCFISNSNRFWTFSEGRDCLCLVGFWQSAIYF